MALLWILLFGFVVGLIAKLLTPGREPGGFLVTAVIGIAGALIANFLGQAAGLYHYGEAPGLVASVLGSVLLLFLHRQITKR